ncbi:MAG TPA: PDZ domain-containing protein [Gemmatimonadaceae bacterium]|nr:PDZ domain-containing protein [Gemmatimonadaceae bacterium]
MPLHRTLAAALTVAVALPAAAQTRMLRSPSVSQRHIAFAHAGNIWIVERSGGAARRLTSFAGEASNPKLSPDGSRVAFSAQYAGNVDVYVVPAEGGEPNRLTFHPGADMVQGWTPDGSAIVFASGRATDAPVAVPRFYQVKLAGGPEIPMPMPRAFQGKISPDGKRIAYRMNSSWDEERRNYRGGQNRPIWIEDLASHEVTTVPWQDSKEMDPAWVGDVVYFLSDRDGVSNVWSYDTRTKALGQVTKFRDFDVKTLDASTSANAVVFEQGGWVHELDPATGRERTVSIAANGDFPWMMPQWKDVTQRVVRLALSPTGKRAAVEARGEIFTVPAEKGDARNLSASNGSAERDPAWSPDGKSISWFSDASGEYKLVISSQDGTGKREIALPEPSHFYTPQWSPDAKRILFHDTHLRLWVVDVASGRATQVDTDPFMMPDRSLNPRFSPDGRWIAYSRRLPSMFRAIFVYDVESGRKQQLTDGLADATSPAWDASGKYLWFLASTNFGLNSGWLDMTSYDHPTTSALYLAVLKKGEPSPLLPESDEESAAVAAARGDSARAAAPAGPGDSVRTARASRPVVTIDLDGIAQRIVAVPSLAQRDYRELEAGAAGTIFWVENTPATGTAETTGPTGGVLHRYTLKERKALSFASNVVDYAVSADGKKLLYRTPGAAGGLYLVDADKAPPAAAAGKLAMQLRMLVDPRAEFAQIFDEGWRNQRDYLYVKNMHGSDWPAMKKMYGALLPSVNHRADLNYLLDMMGAELAIGHSFVRGGDIPEVQPTTAGLLGADFTVENGRYRIAKVYDAESWNPDLRAPLAAPGVDVRAGEYLLSVNGVELRGSDNVYRLLDGTANRQTVLRVSPRPSLDGARTVTVVPVPNDAGLRSRAWVEKSRRLVDSLSGGTLAYVWVPNTGQGGYQSFNRYYFAQQHKRGAIIDERYNGGGSAADYIIDLLGRQFDGYFNNPVGDRYPFTSPAAGIWGPQVMIINEMAGSGGDLMPYMFQHRRIGPLVGKRTWGGLVGTWDTPPFVDGGAMIAPRGGFFDLNGRWAVENVGTSPDIDVENWPREVIAGRDPQLERAVAEALKMAREKPLVRATKEPPGATWGERKP